MAFPCAFLQAEIRRRVTRKVFYLLWGRHILANKFQNSDQEFKKQIKYFIGITLTSSVTQNVTYNLILSHLFMFERSKLKILDYLLSNCCSEFEICLQRKGG